MRDQTVAGSDVSLDSLVRGSGLNMDALPQAMIKSIRLYISFANGDSFSSQFIYS